ncbi:hypothetical protein NDU88_007366 [Pleurodeles waltl]|uniref:Uncharacterized protein n=1 Tax=Pleurodeles waltl TaxID=8319 RepID=A0AAV7TZT7_PLEWA|nr:hypothetical protein NDU88_007366 [Pleurodeles waltl]
MACRSMEAEETFIKNPCAAYHWPAAMCKVTRKRVLDAGGQALVPSTAGAPMDRLLTSHRESQVVHPQDSLQAITASMEALETKIDTLGTGLSILKYDHQCLVERVTKAEKRMADVYPAVSMENKIWVLEARAEDSANRLKRNNIGRLVSRSALRKIC